MRALQSGSSWWLASLAGLVLAAIAVLGVGGCEGGGQGADDDPSYVDADLPDAYKPGGFRDGGDCEPGGGSGGSGGSGMCCESGSGGSGGAGCTAPDAAPACGEHTFTFDSATAQTVLVTGSFSSWAAAPPGARALVNDGAGHFTLTTQLGPGKHTYKLIVDGVWMADPGNPMSEPDGFGGQNSILSLCLPM